MRIYCCTDDRRRLIETKTDLNGIDYVEVVSTNLVQDKQKTLQITFLKPLQNPIEIDQVFLIVEGKRSGIMVEEIIEDSSNNNITLNLSDRGDFSIYTLCLMESWEEQTYLPGFDKKLSTIDFSFKVECFTDVDCKPSDFNCQNEEITYSPEINYLAKDYASFKQLLLDRMSFLMPNWTERNAADLGITLVEILAYVGDYLSYRQDAISTEAYLRTARKRISVRRHARLIDYYMHDGLNARTWVQIQVDESSNGAILKRKDESGFVTKLLTKGVADKIENILISKNQFDKVFDVNQIIFEPVHDVQLFSAHNKIPFHNYGEQNCCLPKGATQATLLGRFEDLKINDVLLLEEIIGPKTGATADANPQHRHAVKITNIVFDTDFDFTVTPAEVIDITLITWNEEDALPFSLCTSTVLDVEEKDQVFEVSVAKGNVLLADHGYSFSDLESVNSEFPFEDVQGSLTPTLVPKSKYQYANVSLSNSCEPKALIPVLPRFYPMLKASPLTQSDQLKFSEADASDLTLSAKKMMSQNIRSAIPSISLHEVLKTGNSFEVQNHTWKAVKDLLVDSSLLDMHFVVEMDSDGTSYLRFGNDINGKAPNANSKFLANYRIGNGTRGNIGRNTIEKVVNNSTINIKSITNPMPATGGKNPETKEEVKQYAPQAFRTQERAVITSDYEAVAKRCKEDIQSVSAKFRWTGSWQTTFIAADRILGEKVTPEWENELRDCLQKYRMAGIDLEVENPQYVGLELDVEVCIQSNTFKIDIQREILSLLSNQSLKNGQKGFFHPDKLIFGQSLYLSQIYALVQAVDGIISVDITKFQRYGLTSSSGLHTGKLDFGKSEIPRLDNDPNHIDMGILKLLIKGGR
ncbi:putative phage baseplate assembly protein [Mariniflexile fucanivorans]|uniref:Putative phage baseplate assembly protein n=1 Tax=Mariniflexile fucanivorans TaxID=264023 RepID=A0A4R1RAV2_9FLAO|nr:putative baseplate assembly protein [Mariniflexile fucanivorans]TCL62848.1 putative phage baseplate assembly protein [Mariniflexile fucanivorans]